MIKNVIFDCGRVLVEYNTLHMTEKHVENPEDALLVEKIVFDRLYWDKLDLGEIADREVVEACEMRLPPHLKGKAGEVYYNWIYDTPFIAGMPELVKEVKYKYSKRIFLLSNMGMYFVDHADEFPLYREFEDCVYSGEVHLTKPQKEIYELLLARNGIKAEETLFIDDSEKNIRGGENVGIRGYLFDGDVEKLRAYLKEVL